MSASNSRWFGLPLAAALATVSLHAQGPRLHAAIAGSEQRGAVPVFAWLCEEFLPTLPSWPEGLDPRGPLSLTLSATGIDVGATEVDLPDDAVAIGTASFTEETGGPSLLWRCDNDGTEQWTVQAGFDVPQHYRNLLHAIEADVLVVPRTLAVPVLAGHLSGSLLEGDPRAALLRIGPSLCGDATWLAWDEGGKVRVRGRSDGGLMLPLALLLIAIADGDAEPTNLQLRAFAARDADKNEATRQLGRADRQLDVETLRSLLRGDDGVRLTAIDALIRRRAWDQLPSIVEAATPELPWATIAARDAVHELWSDATADVRQQTRQALQRSRCPSLRAIDVETIAQPIHAPENEHAPLDPRGRALMILMCTAIGVLGLWSRERVRMQMPTI